MVLCSGARSTLLRTSELLDRVSDGSDLISIMNGFQSLIASEPLDARSNDLKSAQNGATHSTAHHQPQFQSINSSIIESS
ncbi:hypothetical protein RHMOL_Rhmol03G0187500 [Rhododendron molle]|nr:hypothetical protein RHMOL_Rhmol03G0187500 [Rhododendron molle]